MKKIFSAILVLTMLCAMLPMGVSALTEGDWEYKILNNEIMITYYFGKATNLIVPDEIRGLPVTRIQINNADSTRNIKSLTLPDTICEIDSGAFYGSRNLEEIHFSQNLKTIGSRAFENCISLTSIDLSHVENIGEAAFKGCSSLSNVELSEKLTEIAADAFYGTGLANIKIPTSVIKIGACAFSHSALEIITLPGTVSLIDWGCFSVCEKLKTVIISPGTKVLASHPMHNQRNNGTFAYCNALEAIYIPDTVTQIHKFFIVDLDNAIVYCGNNSYAAQLCKEQEISYIIDNSVNSSVHVLLDGERLSFHSYGQNPEIINDRTMVPLRSIFEALGASVDWNDATQTVTSQKGNTKISLQIGSSQMYVNGSAKTLDVPAMLKNGRTLVPVRAISEAFSCNVGWDDNTQTVMITQ